MLGKQTLSWKFIAIELAIVICSTASQAFASDSSWLRAAKQADDLHKKGDVKASRDCWIEVLKQVDTKPEADPWTPLALRNIIDTSLWLDDIDTAEKYSIRHVAELEKMGEEYPDLARAYILRGRIFMLRRDFNRSQQCMSKAYKLAHHEAVDVTDLSDALLYSSANYEVLNERKKSENCQHECIDAFKRRRGSIAAAPIGVCAGILMQASNAMPDKPKKAYRLVARNYFQVLLDDGPSLGFPASDLPGVLLSMGTISETLGEPERAFAEVMKARDLCMQPSGLSISMRAHALMDISHILSVLRRPAEAAQSLEAGWSLLKQTDEKDKPGRLLMMRLGELYVEAKDYQRARLRLLESLNFPTNQLEHCYTSTKLAECSIRMGNTSEFQRYLNMAVANGLALSKTLPLSQKSSDDFGRMIAGFDEVREYCIAEQDAKSAAKTHAVKLELLKGVKSKPRDVAAQYVYQGFLDVDARRITEAEKDAEISLALAKYSIYEPEKKEIRSEQQLSEPPDDARWKYIETFRLRGLCAFYKGDSKKALEFFREFLVLSEKKSSWPLGTYYAKFGGACFYLQMGMLKEAEELFKQVIDYSGSKKYLADFHMTSCFWYAVTLCEDRNYAESSRYCQLALQLCQKSGGRQKWVSMTEALQGRVASKTGHHAEAQALFEKAISAMERDSPAASSQDIANVMYWQIQDCLELNQKEKAQQLAKKALQLYSLRNTHVFNYETECRKLMSAK